jgi:hypothetical protein
MNRLIKTQTIIFRLTVDSYEKHNSTVKKIPTYWFLNLFLFFYSFEAENASPVKDKINE